MKINGFLSRIELQKSLDEKKRKTEIERLSLLAEEMLVNPYGYNKLSESLIWNRTKKENKALISFRQKVKGYKPRHSVQEAVISFSNISAKRFLRLDKSVGDVDKYISASSYWSKSTVEVLSKKTGKKVKIVYAHNSEMESTIFEYMKKIIITTNSSFENFLRDIEGKPYKVEFHAKGNSEEAMEKAVDYNEVKTPVNHMDVLSVMDTVAKFNEKDEETMFEKMLKKTITREK